MDSIQFKNRATGQLETEKVYGDWGVKFLYQTAPGYLLERAFFCRKPFSYTYGLFNDSALSAQRIDGFVQNFAIPMEQFQVPQGGFRSFNEFFIRKYKAGIRNFPEKNDRFGSPAEGRVLVYENIDERNVFPIKGHGVSLLELFQNDSLAARYKGGVAMVIRLCPVDYHRFHFPDDGKVSEFRAIAGSLHSVNPLALLRRPTVFADNERHLTVFDSKNFGTVVLMEVGALGVGKMIQTFSAESPVKKGAEKGYFCFGASTVLVFLEKSSFVPDRDLIQNTTQKIETYVRLGESLGRHP